MRFSEASVIVYATGYLVHVVGCVIQSWVHPCVWAEGVIRWCLSQCVLKDPIFSVRDMNDVWGPWLCDDVNGKVLWVRILMRFVNSRRCRCQRSCQWRPECWCQGWCESWCHYGCDCRSQRPSCCWVVQPKLIWRMAEDIPGARGRDTVRRSRIRV